MFYTFWSNISKSAPIYYISTLLFMLLSAKNTKKINDAPTIVVKGASIFEEELAGFHCKKHRIAIEDANFQLIDRSRGVDNIENDCIVQFQWHLVSKLCSIRSSASCADYVIQIFLSAFIHFNPFFVNVFSLIRIISTNVL